MKDFIDSLRWSCLGHRESLEATYLMARDVIRRGIPGDFVECGVYQGAECAVMAKAIIDAACHVDGTDQYSIQPLRPYGRRVHLFDSFQGMPQCGPEDSEFLTSGNKPGEACCSLDGVKENMCKWGIPDELLVYHPGWFEFTMPVDRLPRSIALLRLDSDLYESTKICMKYMWPLVSHGGWVIVDDYQLSGCRKAVSEVVIPMPMYFQNL